MSLAYQTTYRAFKPTNLDAEALQMLYTFVF